MFRIEKLRRKDNEPEPGYNMNDAEPSILERLPSALSHQAVNNKATPPTAGLNS